MENRNCLKFCQRSLPPSAFKDRNICVECHNIQRRISKWRSKSKPISIEIFDPLPDEIKLEISLIGIDSFLRKHSRLNQIIGAENGAGKSGAENGAGKVNGTGAGNGAGKVNGKSGAESGAEKVNGTGAENGAGKVNGTGAGNGAENGAGKSGAENGAGKSGAENGAGKVNGMVNSSVHQTGANLIYRPVSSKSTEEVKILEELRENFNLLNQKMDRILDLSQKVDQILDFQRRLEGVGIFEKRAQIDISVKEEPVENYQFKLSEPEVGSTLWWEMYKNNNNLRFNNLKKSSR